ncbi:glycosyltransferase family 2 protein [Thermoanaerobacter pentosaceus]|uniref:GT2 family glycosyltransferase n=1 Tax=Thermoanaerobacter pentosaceus TaxID=694059 RepID=A0ABT9M5R9_9THEO|nr:glycosyltransferase family 2 protein [Thermoanaerobacter pentosaceus]MDP9751446.1 GT2 family glycosyltransferase [Thermoanaerobacter pentosaceus]
MSDNVCAVVVTYNRKNLLIECLEALQKQTRPIQGIYLIDNASTDGTPELLLEKGYISELPPQNLKEPWEKEFSISNFTDGNSIKLHYVRMYENTGGAGGFYEGVKRGYEKGYDWLWLMDDDAEPKEDALEKLETYFLLDNISALACLKVDKNMNILHPHRGYFNFKNVFSGIVKKFDKSDIKKEFIEIDHASFVGILVNSKAIMKIGYPKKEFFIHYDDVEYCIRLRTIGKILLIPKSIIVHKEAAKGGVEKSFLGRRSKRIEFNKFWLSYYGMRNLVWLGKQYSENELLFYIQMIKHLIRLLVGVILFDDNRTLRIRLILEAYKNGLIGNFDNSIPKKIFYRGEK